MSCRYDLFKQILLRNKVPVIDYQMQDGLLLHSVSSVLAGTVATSKSFLASCDVIPSCSLRFLSAITAPADVLRSRLMAAVRDSSISGVRIWPHVALL